MPSQPLRMLGIVWAALLLTLQPAAALAQSSPLQQRLNSWPTWNLPAPLPRPAGNDLIYPDWFAGQWQATGSDLSDGNPDLHYVVHFAANARGQIVGERAFNARSIGKALLGDQLLSVSDDPRNPNRQLAQLQQDQRLESTVVGRRMEQPAPELFLADELALQVLHGPGDPRVSRVETLSRYRQIDADHIEAEQWQASYGSPADGLAAEARRSWRGSLRLERIAIDQERPT